MDDTQGMLDQENQSNNDIDQEMTEEERKREEGSTPTKEGEMPEDKDTEHHETNN